MSPCFTRTTGSDHDGLIFPSIARDFEVHGPDQPWVADLTYIAIATGFIHIAPRHRARAGGAPMARSWMFGRGASWDMPSAAASMPGTPWPGCVLHSDRGSQYASEKHRALLNAKASPAP